jgi:dTDP-4-amino-4,6-dideoxygalactose transaminase
MSDWPQWPQVDRRTLEAVSTSLVARQWSVSGPPSHYTSFVAKAENDFARLIGRKYCVTTCNGSSAIVIALQALAIGPGNRVLLPATTWVGCATAVLRVGALPVFMDGSARTPCTNPDGDHGIDSDSIDAILAVHLYASHEDIDGLRRWAPRAKIVEDCSHCHGALDSKGRPLGTLGDISIFSFQATKVLTCGEGGAAVTDEPELAARLAALRADSRKARRGNYSEIDLEPAHLVHGANFILSEIHAALLCDQMERLRPQSMIRVRGVETLVERLKGTPLRVVGDKAALECGTFYGVLVAGITDVWGQDADQQQLLQLIEGATDARCLEVYPPVPSGPLYLPKTNSLYAAAGAPVHQYPQAERWHHDAIVIPHQLFLAEPELITSLADAILSPIKQPSVSTVRELRSGGDLPGVTAVVLTRGRPDKLSEALRSIANQDYAGFLATLVFGDNAPYIDEVTEPYLAKLPLTQLNINGWLAESRQSLFERVTILRNLSLELVKTPLVCFLDDDNVWMPDHVSSLVNVMRASGVPAVHSWRRLVQEDGSDWIPNDFPWLASGSGSRALFDAYVSYGVFNSGDSVVRDVASLVVGETDLGMVDLGEWIFEKSLLDIVGFDPSFSDVDLARRSGEDDKLLQRLRALGVPTACTAKPTLIYRLGGFSNAGGDQTHNDGRSVCTHGN